MKMAAAADELDQHAGFVPDYTTDATAAVASRIADGERLVQTPHLVAA